MMELLPTRRNKRKLDAFYEYKGEIVFWNGRRVCCEHKRNKSTCKACLEASFCKHLLKKILCEECGSEKCIHGNSQKDCKRCEGTHCRHDVIKAGCRECGTRFCEHKKEKYSCKQCGGSAICVHNKRKSICRECKGGSFCEHDKRRDMCRECGGSAFCEHDTIKRICKTCKGSSICEHLRQKAECRECESSLLCKHGKRKSRCKEGCGGSAICEHNRIKITCQECGGSQRCQHQKFKRMCRICKVNPENWCKNCNFIFIRPSCKTKPYCFSCYCFLNPDVKIIRKPKFKETFFRNFLQDEFPEFKFNWNIAVDGGCSGRRPDFWIDFILFIFIIELDENQHGNYTCENKRLMEICNDFSLRPMIVYRINPDAYVDEFMNHPSCFEKNNDLNVEEWKIRSTIIKNDIQKILDNRTKIPEKEITITNYFFNTKTQKSK